MSFMEEKGDVSGQNRLSAAPMVRSTVSAIELAFQGDALPTKKTPAFMIMLIVALEFLVRPFVLRSYALVLLVRVWGALRTDDCRGLLPDTIKLSEGGREARLDRSKTSGPGRKVRWLPVFVSHEAFLAREEWMVCGARLGERGGEL